MKRIVRSNVKGSFTLLPSQTPRRLLDVELEAGRRYTLLVVSDSDTYPDWYKIAELPFAGTFSRGVVAAQLFPADDFASGLV